MDITNNSGSIIGITRFYATWFKSSASQKIDRLILGGTVVWNKSDPNSPSDIPTEGNWLGGVGPAIPNATTENFVIQFSDNLQPPTVVHIVFDIGCQVIGSQ
jgi:hypothetical protein